VGVGSVVVPYVEGAADEARQRDEVLLRGLLRRCQRVPLEREGVGELRLGERQADLGFGRRVSESTGVEVDLVGSWKENERAIVSSAVSSGICSMSRTINLPDADVLPESLRQGRIPALPSTAATPRLNVGRGAQLLGLR